MARKLIWFSLFLQFIFAILVTITVHLPSPEYWQKNDTYYVVFGSTLRFVAAGTCANIVSNFMNVYLVSRLKIPMEGRFFWIRSMLSIMISGFLMVTIIIVTGFSGKELDFIKSWIMFKSTYSCEIFYALILALPAAFIARFLKRSEGVDVYDHNTNFNPFCFK